MYCHIDMHRDRMQSIFGLLMLVVMSLQTSAMDMSMQLTITPPDIDDEPDIYMQHTTTPNIEPDIYMQHTTTLIIDKEPDIYTQYTTTHNIDKEPDIYTQYTTTHNIEKTPDIYTQSTTTPNIDKEPDIYMQHTTLSIGNESNTYTQHTTATLNDIEMEQNSTHHSTVLKDFPEDQVIVTFYSITRSHDISLTICVF